jgi:3-oxoadipate enol-lactonase
MMMMINGCRLNVEIRGEGTPLIMLHGLGNTMASFHTDIEHFSSSHRTIALDSRGHGLSDKPLSYTLQDHVDDVVALADELGLSRVAVIGSSMGSYVAQGVAVQIPQRVVKLVLVAAKSHGASSSSAVLLKKHEDELKGATVLEQRNFLYSKILAPSTPERRAEVLQMLAENRAPAQTDAEYKIAQAAIADFDFRPRLKEISAPTLVISGRYDPLNSPEEGRQIADLVPNATLMVFESSGHLPRIEERERYFAAVDKFLGDVDA